MVAGGNAGARVLSAPGVKFGRVGAVMRGTVAPVADVSVLVIIVSDTVRPEIWRSGTIWYPSWISGQKS